MLLADPHFPWVGAERFYQFQPTLPGKLNVQGASLHGIPVVNIGFNDHVAWSHTVSTAWRFTRSGSSSRPATRARTSTAARRRP